MGADGAVCAAWVTDTACPATVTTPVRCVCPVLAATVKPTLPLPEPLAPLVIVIQLTLLTAVHEQPAFAVTETVLELPLAGAATVVGVTV